jgi:hypothetical protein
MYKVKFQNIFSNELHYLKQLHPIINQMFSFRKNLWLLSTLHIICIMQMFQILLFEIHKC